MTSRAPTDDMVAGGAVNSALSPLMAEDVAYVVQPTAISGAVSAV